MASFYLFIFFPILEHLQLIFLVKGPMDCYENCTDYFPTPCDDGVEEFFHLALTLSIW
jgi:hypothetical protein